MPRSSGLASVQDEAALGCQLYGGDDYELCFSLDPGRAGQLEVLARQQQLAVTRIGVIESQPGIRCRRDDGSLYTPQGAGFDHFRVP